MPCDPAFRILRKSSEQNQTVCEQQNRLSWFLVHLWLTTVPNKLCSSSEAFSMVGELTALVSGFS